MVVTGESQHHIWQEWAILAERIREEVRQSEREGKMSALFFYFLCRLILKIWFFIDGRESWISIFYSIKNQANRCQPSLPQSWYSLTHAIFKHFKHCFPYCAKTVRNDVIWIQVAICSHVLQYHSAMTAASNDITEAIIILSTFICMCTGWSHL